MRVPIVRYYYWARCSITQSTNPNHLRASGTYEDEYKNEAPKLTYLTVVGRRHKFLIFLAVKNVDANKVALGVTVLPSLGGGDIRNLS